MKNVYGATVLRGARERVDGARRCRSIGVLGVMGALSAGGAFGAEEVLELPAYEVVGRYLYTDQVNALRTPTPVLDVPQSLTIWTAEQMQEAGVSRLGQVADYVAGITTSQGEGHRDAVVFRGVRSTADFFLDGVRDDVQYYRPVYNLEQVEILRGPNALMFGRGGAGGIINRVTKKGIFGESFTHYSASVDTFGAYSAQVDTNVGLGEGAAFRLNAMHEQLENHRDYYGGRRFGIHATFKVRVGPRTQVDVSYEGVDHERTIDRGVPTGRDGYPVEAFRKMVFGDPEEDFAELRAHLFRASAQHVFSDSLKANVSAYYGDFDKVYQNFFTSGYDEVSRPEEVVLDGYIDTTLRENLILAGNLVGALGEGAVRHTFIVGTEYIATRSDQDRYNSLWSTTGTDKEVFRVGRPLSLRGGLGVNALGQATRNTFAEDLADDTRVAIEVMSFYVQDEVELSRNWHLILGGRFDRFDIRVNNVPAQERRSRVDTELSPRMGLIYKPRESISLYASRSETFLPRSGEQFDNINGDRERLDPDTFSNLEAGMKWDFRQELSLTLALFEVRKRSPQVADSDPSTLDIIDSRIRGLEAQVQGRVHERWLINAGYSYLTGEQVNRAGATGLRPVELPRHMFSVWNRFTLTSRLGLALGLTHQDETYINNANTARLPAYTRIDGAVYYELSERLRLHLHVENLTDTLYFPNAHSTHEATVGAPLNARLALNGRF